MRAYAYLYAVNCTFDERDQVRAITKEELLRLRCGLQKKLGTASKDLRIRVLCFGASTSPKNLPSPLNQWWEHGTYGAWMPTLHCAVARFNELCNIRRIVIHEVSHALLDLLTNGFPYPPVIEEGLARWAEYLLRDGDGVSLWNRIAKKRGACVSRYLREDECISIKRLLLLDYDNMHAMTRAKSTDYALWLTVYLWRLSMDRPALKEVFRQLREYNMTSGEVVYQWIQDASGMNKDEIENGFRRYCMTGCL